VLLPLIAAALLLGVAPGHTQVSYAVVRVVDGDTVVLRDIGTVRLIGVDIPETVDTRKPVQHYGREASAFLATMLTGGSVRLEYDQQRTDKY